jgi:hypothetical protein
MVRGVVSNGFEMWMGEFVVCFVLSLYWLGGFDGTKKYLEEFSLLGYNTV